MPKLKRTICVAFRARARIAGQPRHPARLQDHVAGGGEGARFLDHRHADIALLERPRVIQPVADHHHAPAGLLEPADEAQLVQRALVEMQGGVAAEQAPEALPLLLVVPAQERELITLAQAAQKLAGLGPHRIGQHERAAQRPINGQAHHASRRRQMLGSAPAERSGDGALVG